MKTLKVKLQRLEGHKMDSLLEVVVRLSMVTMGYNDHIETKDQFIASFSRSNDEVHYFLCELYMHNLIMVYYEDWELLLLQPLSQFFL